MVCDGTVVGGSNSYEISFLHHPEDFSQGNITYTVIINQIGHTVLFCQSEEGEVCPVQKNDHLNKKIIKSCLLRIRCKIETPEWYPKRADGRSVFKEV